MNHLTTRGKEIVRLLQDQHGISHDSAITIVNAVQQGNGTMAQFSTVEFGLCQWMRGGMTMVGDMFNNAMRDKVDRICSEVASELPGGALSEPASLRSDAGAWWPGSLGTPASSGSQNSSRYAIFPASRRLAILRGGVLELYDTGEHRISGIGQQQGSSEALSFTSQLGVVNLKSLPRVSNS
jgi:hypothetical protein